MSVQLGEFVVDRGRRLVTRRGRTLHLAPKPYALLELLLDHHPEAVSKDQLTAELWRGAVVSETALTTVVNDLRHGLGESAREPVFLRTVHGFGYALQGEIRELPVEDQAVRGFLVGAELRLPIRAGETVLGRTGSGTVPDASVSRRHARLVANSSGVCVEDLGSKNGTFLNEKLVLGLARIEDGDELRLGLARLTFREISSDASTRTASDASARRSSSRQRAPR